MTNQTVSISWPFLELDSKGRVRIAGTRIRLTMIVEARYAHGWSPEEIVFQYPVLSLAQVYSALSYYYAYQEEIDREIANEHKEIEEIKDRLKEMGAFQEGEALKTKLLARAKGKNEKI